VSRPPIHIQLPAATPVPAGLAGAPVPAAGRAADAPPAPPSSEHWTHVVHGLGDCVWHGLYRAAFGCPGCLSLARAVDDDTAGRTPIVIGGAR